jgi:cobalt-precorrin-5B (C1)-methyltransferase
MTKRPENLRSGYTTGACATAATKGALVALVEQRPVETVTIQLPIGRSASFSLASCTFTATAAASSVIKDAGDDPDVTHGAEICSRVAWQAEEGVHFARGSGVGIVTKPGLPIPVGEPAINPVPRRMMREVVGEVLAAAGIKDRGVQIEISVPRGEELARKTFNPRLGIVGGISILGTTGIVEPYSTAAWLASVVQAIDVARAQGAMHLVLSVGARGERFARRALPGLPDVAFVQIGPFFGEALAHCAKAGIERVTLFAMIGKLAKFAAGNASVHSSQSRQDFAFLSQLATEVGAADELTGRIRTAHTAQEVAEMVSAARLPRFFDRLCEYAWNFAQPLIGGAQIEVLVTGIQEEVLGRFPPRASYTQRVEE